MHFPAAKNCLSAQMPWGQTGGAAWNAAPPVGDRHQSRLQHIPDDPQERDRYYEREVKSGWYSQAPAPLSAYIPEYLKDSYPSSRDADVGVARHDHPIWRREGRQWEMYGKQTHRARPYQYADDHCHTGSDVRHDFLPEGTLRAAPPVGDRHQSSASSSGARDHSDYRSRPSPPTPPKAPQPSVPKDGSVESPWANFNPNPPRYQGSRTGYSGTSWRSQGGQSRMDMV